MVNWVARLFVSIFIVFLLFIMGVAASLILIASLMAIKHVADNYGAVWYCLFFVWAAIVLWVSAKLEF